MDDLDVAADVATAAAGPSEVGPPRGRAVKQPDERQQTTGEFAREAQAALTVSSGQGGNGTGKPRTRGRSRTPASTSSAPRRGRAPTPSPSRGARALGIVLPAILVLGLIAAALAALGIF